MSITKIEPQQLCKMGDTDGLVIQGCGGDLQEWVDGINDMLAEAKILHGDSKFENCYTFKNGNLTCLLFPFKDVRFDMGRLAMWRLQTHGNFGGTWLSDYAENRLGGFIQSPPKPKCPLINQNGNIFNLMGIATRTLKENGMSEQAKEMCKKITSSGSYCEALGIIGEYVEITSMDECEDETEDMDMEMEMR